MLLKLTFPLSTEVNFHGEAFVLQGKVKRIRIRTRSTRSFLQIVNHPFLKDTHLNVKSTKRFYQIDLPETYAMLFHNDKSYTPPPYRKDIPP